MKKLNLKKNETPGHLITFCGLDGCGKSTMIRRLQADLVGKHPLFLTKQPTDAVRRSPIFRTYIDTPHHDAFDYRSLSLLAASDRVQHVNKQILPEMETGKTVLCDRYFYSCLANLCARGFQKDQWIYEISSAIIRPDAAFFLDLPVETAVARVRARPEEKERYIDMDLQYRLREEYLEICQQNGGILISTEKPEEICYDEIKKIVREVLGDDSL